MLDTQTAFYAQVVQNVKHWTPAPSECPTAATTALNLAAHQVSQPLKAPSEAANPATGRPSSQYHPPARTMICAVLRQTSR